MYLFIIVRVNIPKKKRNTVFYGWLGHLVDHINSEYFFRDIWLYIMFKTTHHHSGTGINCLILLCMSLILINSTPWIYIYIKQQRLRVKSIGHVNLSPGYIGANGFACCFLLHTLLELRVYIYITHIITSDTYVQNFFILIYRSSLCGKGVFLYYYFFFFF